jgi:hypothetical protein
MEAALERPQSLFGQVVFADEVLVVVALRASERDLSGIDFGLLVLRRQDLMLAMTVGTYRNIAYALGEVLAVHAFEVILQDTGVTLSTSIWHLPSGDGSRWIGCSFHCM